VIPEFLPVLVLVLIARSSGWGAASTRGWIIGVGRIVGILLEIIQGASEVE
jgi:hypothetical protein